MLDRNTIVVYQTYNDAIARIIGKLKSAMRQFPVDVIKVDNQSTTTGQSRVEIGKYLTDRIYLGYANHAQLELRSRRSFSLDSMYGDAGVGSFDVSWTCVAEPASNDDYSHHALKPSTLFFGSATARRSHAN